TAADACVPLISASPSFGPRSAGRRPARASAAAPSSAAGSSPTVARPSPISTSDRCASGARSPLAPTEPRLGTTGCTRGLGAAISSSSVDRRMPENPFASTFARSAIMARTARAGSGASTPAAWLRSRLRCSSPSASFAIFTSASDPKPVLIPYTGASPAAWRSTTARAASTARAAAGASDTGAHSSAMAASSDNVSDEPSSRIIGRSRPYLRTHVRAPRLRIECFGHMAKNIAVLGAQWGDEGKGKIVDLLTPNFSIVARYQGGHNAGHTVYANGRKFVLRLLPSGILHEGITCVIGNGVVVDPQALFAEIDEIAKAGVAIGDRLIVSDKAHLILPYHRELDLLSEARPRHRQIPTP